MDTRIMKRLRHLIPALLVTVCASAASAQTGAQWSAVVEDLGANIYASALHGSKTMSITCTAPSPQGRSPLENFENEIHKTGPFEVYIGMHEPYFDWSAGMIQTGPTIFLGQNGYRLPAFELDELSGTVVRLPMTDALIAALPTATGLVLDTGQGRAFDFGVAGLAGAVEATLTTCVTRWAELGHAVPAALGRFRAGADTPVAGNDSASGAPAAMAEYARADIFNGCSGAARVDADAILRGDIDGDGVEDAVLDWGGVVCNQGITRPFCGASMCSADVYLSSAYGRTGGPVQLLALGVDLQPLTNGLQGVSLGGSLSMCNSAGQGDGGCRFIWYWNGADLVQLK